ncbi:MAG TPA: hypothetical protein DDY71_09855, partial [Spirochaetia bacterium]|nr:hypothetical protein [Spirochaetia bacterium]HBI37936.1 hypothetical protein [Spirochaetia bacterium]
MDKCPCQSGLNYNECCEPFIKGGMIKS